MKQAIDKLISKELKQAGRNLKREKARCEKLYPDWKDDEYNMLDNKFIWGYTENLNYTPSFLTWDDAYVYYNRVNRKYYMTIDMGYYGAKYKPELARTEAERLSRIDRALRSFLSKNGISFAQIFPFDDPALEADSLAELYFKFHVMTEGYLKIII